MCGKHFIFEVHIVLCKCIKFYKKIMKIERTVNVFVFDKKHEKSKKNCVVLLIKLIMN